MRRSRNISCVAGNVFCLAVIEKNDSCWMYQIRFQTILFGVEPWRVEEVRIEGWLRDVGVRERKSRTWTMLTCISHAIQPLGQRFQVLDRICALRSDRQSITFEGKNLGLGQTTLRSLTEHVNNLRWCRTMMYFRDCKLELRKWIRIFFRGVV